MSTGRSSILQRSKALLDRVTSVTNNSQQFSLTPPRPYGTLLLWANLYQTIINPAQYFSIREDGRPVGASQSGTSVPGHNV
jgi:hypothetical protein